MVELEVVEIGIEYDLEGDSLGPGSWSEGDSRHVSMVAIED